MGLAIDTNTRSCSEQESARRVAEVVRKVCRMRPDWLFKKVDSVLRGPVLAVAVGYLALDEPVFGAQFAGGLLVLAGVWMVRRGR